MPFFTLFPSFPFEIRSAIWTFAVPEPEPEVCIVWPLVIRSYPGQREQPLLPFTVDTAWPSVFHACRESREAVLSSGAFRLRHSPRAGFAVPFRAFDPAIDTLYWGKFQSDAMHYFFTDPASAALGRALRHIAIEVPALYPQKLMAETIRQTAICLRTLSLVLPDTKHLDEDEDRLNCHAAHISFLPPARRCRLRDLSSDVAQKTTITDVPLVPAHWVRTMPLRAYMEHRRWEMDQHVRTFNVVGTKGNAWSDEDSSFSGLEIKARTFVHYKGPKPERWVEVCGHYTLDGSLGKAGEPCYIQRTHCRNPEEYRVLDDNYVSDPAISSGEYELELFSENRSLRH